MDANKVLTYLENCSKINLNEVLQEIDMQERRQILKQHNFQIWKATNGKWYTYIPDETKGRILKKRSTEKDLEDFLVDFYREKQNNPMVSEVFSEWINRKLTFNEISKGSADRYSTDFERFFVKTGFASRRIKYITSENLEDFIREQICEKHLTQKTYSGLRIIVRGVWKYAKRQRYTTLSISEFFGDLELSKNTFERVAKDPSSQVFSEDEVPILIDELKLSRSIWDLAVALALETGLRVGELSTLKSSDWDGGKILKIRRTEVRFKDSNGKNCLGVREFTKTDAGMRNLILTTGGIETLKLILEINPHGMFLFENAKGKRIRGNTLNKHLDIVLKRLDLPHRSIHKCRKTYGTTLIDAGCDDAVVMNQLGHASIDTSRKYYYYSNRTREHQIEQVENAIQI